MRRRVPEHEATPGGPGKFLKSWYSLVASRASVLRFGEQIELPNPEYSYIILQEKNPDFHTLLRK